MKQLLTVIIALSTSVLSHAQSVGIGTNSPNASAQLEIASASKGLLIPRMTTAQRNAIASPASGLMLYDTDRRAFYHYDGSIWRTMLNSDYWNRVSYTSNYVYNLQDSIGIGVASPTHRLDVSGNIRSRRNLLVDSSVTVKGKINADGDIISASTVKGNALLATGNMLVSGTGVVNGDLTSNSSVIINNANAILQLKTTGADKGFIQVSGDDIRVGTNSTNTNGRFIVRTGGNNNLVVNSDGNVGIGTAAPASTLHVVGHGLFYGSGEVLAINGTSNPNIGFYANGVYKSFISQSASELFIGVNNASLHLDATQIAIGGVIPAASGYKLTVTGKVICEELKVQLQAAWPDYVFNEKYKLMPLGDLRSYINANDHLPNIPAAAAIEKSGMEVGEMQRKMMEKIEELTLYVLELEERLNKIQKNK